MASHGGREHPVWLRTARGPDGAIYIDLGTPDWSTVKVTGAGWAVVGSRGVPVKFVRGCTTGALPVPTPGWGDVRELGRFLNVEGEAGFKLVLAWLIQTLKPEGPYPLLNIEGEQGSAKSSTAKVLYSLVSPSAIAEPLRTLPKDERDLLVAARNNWCLAYDNLSWMPEWLSDALCRLATGGAFGTRTLHTNAEETLLSAKRPVIINSIGGVINRPDLQDRALIVEAPFIPESERRTEAGLRADFEEAAPVIFSGLLDGISAAMRAPVSEDTGGPRLIDFMRWVGPALEYYGYTGLEADYAAMRDEADILALENDPVALVLMAAIEDEWIGTPTDLLRKLTNRAPASVLINTKVWPQNAKAMGRRLARIASVLRRVGLEVSDERIPGGNRTRTKVIRWSDGADRKAIREALGIADEISL